MDNWIFKINLIDNEKIKNFTFNWNNISGLFKQVQLLLYDYLEKYQIEEEKSITYVKEEITLSDSFEKKQKYVNVEKNKSKFNIIYYNYIR